MREFRKLVIVIPAALLAALLLVLSARRGTVEELTFQPHGPGQSASADASSGGDAVDQHPYSTAQTLSALAVSAEEQAFAQEAERLADHEVDQAFALALRQASIAPRSMSPEAAALASRVQTLKGLIKDDSAKVDGLSAAAKSSGIPPAEGDDLDIAKAQLGLDTDELADATEDLARESGDRRGAIQAELAAREAAMKKAEGDAPKKDAAVNAVRLHATLRGRLAAWFDGRTRAKLIEQARILAVHEAADLGRQHRAMEGEQGPDPAELRSAAGAEHVKLLQRMAAHRAMMSIEDDRVDTDGRLAAVYAQWQAQVWLEHRILGYLVLQSIAWVIFIVLAAAVVAAAGRVALAQVATEARQARTLGTVVTLAAELLGLLGVLVVLFGVPQQMPTILGLATAGLTVVFQDFILAFFGWFVLMGRNGIRVSDWVEIDGVGGEVAEIGLFRTVLLETGNWTSRGHPTGRKVRFINSFAIRGQYFNFSTHGQWMWDEIKLNVPATAEAYELIRKMQEAVEQETAKDTEQASAEWQKATGDVCLSQFSANPTVDLRPAASGVDVIVRFVTRAGARFESRNRLYDVLLGLMAGTERPSPSEETQSIPPAPPQS